MRERAVPSSLEASRGRADRFSRKNHLIPENSRSRAQPQDELLVLEAPTPRSCLPDSGRGFASDQSDSSETDEGGPDAAATPAAPPTAESRPPPGLLAPTCSPRYYPTDVPAITAQKSEHFLQTGTIELRVNELRPGKEERLVFQTAGAETARMFLGLP